MATTTTTNTTSTSPPSSSSSSSHEYTYQVTMTCGGCSGAVERVLKRLEGVKSYSVSLEHQTATVVTAEDSGLDYDRVLATIKKTGKTVVAGEADGVVRSVE
ncbi:MAG: Cytosolic copper metallochaperone [Phylliscum demangeonii]|nr:MAG: Cytosolic copper metallochaperone [Phylliscum demangeonii]